MWIVGRIWEEWVCVLCWGQAEAKSNNNPQQLKGNKKNARAKQFPVIAGGGSRVQWPEVATWKLQLLKINFYICLVLQLCNSAIIAPNCSLVLSSGDHVSPFLDIFSTKIDPAMPELLAVVLLGKWHWPRDVQGASQPLCRLCSPQFQESPPVWELWCSGSSVPGVGPRALSCSGWVMDLVGERVKVSVYLLAFSLVFWHEPCLLLPSDETSLKNTQLKIDYTDLEFLDSSESVPCFHLLPSVVLLLLIKFRF